MKIALTELKVITISLDMGKSKWQISEKKGPKITKISKADISGTVWSLVKKILLTFVSY